MIPGWGRSAGEGIGLPAPVLVGFPDGSDTKESACNVGDLGSIPGSGRSHGEGNGNPLQYGNGYPLQYSFISVYVSFILFLNLFLFLWPCWVFAVACGIFSWDMGAHSCGRWDPGPRAGIEHGPRALGTQTLIYWTTREVPAGDSFDTSSGALTPQHPPPHRQRDGSLPKALCVLATRNVPILLSCPCSSCCSGCAGSQVTSWR